MSLNVWVRTRVTKGKTTYHLRWVCPAEKCWKSKRVGTDRKVAEREAAILSTTLGDGTYRADRKVPWVTFADEHVATVAGSWHKRDVRRTLDLFAEVCKPNAVGDVTYRMLEAFNVHLRDIRKNTLATRNKRFRVLKAALRAAVRRDYLLRSPMDRWQWEREDVRLPRALTEAEKRALLAAAPEGVWRTLIYTALTSGCRRGELLALTWADVDLENARLIVRHTKGKRDRVQPIPPATVEALRKVQADTLRIGGPFRGVDENRVPEAFRKIVATAGIEACTFHDLRRTFCTDLARAGVNQLVVQRLAGHASSVTTATYYQAVDDPMKREAVARLAL